MPSTFYLYSAAVSRGGRNSIAPTSASPVRYVSPSDDTLFSRHLSHWATVFQICFNSAMLLG